MTNDDTRRWQPAAMAGLGLSQNARLITLATQQDATRPEALLVERFTGREAVNELFCFDIDALSISARLDIDSFVGQDIALRLLQPDGTRRVWHGLCTDSAWTGSDGGAVRYRVRLEPALAQLRLRRDNCVFRDVTVQAVAEDLLRGYGSIAFQFRISQTLTTHATLTQYRESDLDFLTRILAMEGLSWRFEHTPDGQPAQGTVPLHTLVIFDSAARAPAMPGGADLRFHGVRSADSDDAIDRFGAHRQVQANQIRISGWDPARLSAPAGLEGSLLDAGYVPVLPLYDGSGERPYADRAAADRHALRMLRALEMDNKRFVGAGAVRRLAAGHRFRLTQHDSYAGDGSGADGFVTTWVEHEGRNNYTPVLGPLGRARHDPDSAIYRNRFGCVRDSVAILPRAITARSATSAPGPQTALVVGPSNSVAWTTRDHLVSLQFGWQRGPDANPGSPMQHSDVSGKPDANGRAAMLAPVRAAEALAGPNWGTRHTARNGTEALVVFIEGNIDRPLMIAQLYNGRDRPPFAAGAGSNINHAGMISGLHTNNFAAGDANQWLTDDTKDQPRMRLASTGAQSQLNLGHLIQQPLTSAQRGNYRGRGFELRTDGWAMLRGGAGLLLSTTARPAQGTGISSTQLDTLEAASQLRGAAELGKALAGAASQQKALTSKEALTAQLDFIRHIDPKQDGKFSGQVGNIPALKPKPETRQPDPAQPVEKFAVPLVLMDAPATINWATPGSTVLFAGQQLSWTMQGDLHIAAGHTSSLVAANAVGLFSHDGGIQAIAGNGPLSLQAHTDRLEILADQAITVVCVDGAINIMAKHKIVLQAGRCAITLDEGNITFACPGNFTVKGGQHLFKGGGRAQVAMEVLPSQVTKITNFIALNYRDADGDPMAGVAYVIKFTGGSVIRGKLDDEGNAKHENVPEKPISAEYEARKPSPESPWDPLSKMLDKAHENFSQ